MDIFAEDPNSNDQGFTNDVTVDDNVNYLEVLVGDGKKFKSVEELARGKAEADAFIAKLIKEQEELRKDLNSRTTLEEFMTKMNTNGNNQNSQTTVTTQNEGSNGNGSNIDLEALKKQVLEDLKRDQQVNKREQNIATAATKLQELVGTQANALVQARAKELGVSIDFLKNAAAESPDAFVALVAANAPKKNDPGFTPPGSKVNTSAGLGDSSVDRTDSYYRKLKQQNPRAYWDPKTQVAMHRDALRLGEKFFD